MTSNGHVAAGASPGILTVDGNYTQGAGGTLDVEVAKLIGAVAGTDFDRLAVTGTATLGGTVNAIPLAGFVPSTGTGIDVVTAGTRSGVFANVISTPSPLAGNLVPEARYDTTTAKLFVVPGGGAADDSVPEAAGTKTVTVTLSAPSSETATMNYATADGSAKAGEDYSARSGTLTFAPNDTSETFDVPITSDTRDESDESFLVNLSNPVNTVLTDTQASVSIIDDDAAPVAAIGDVVKSEGSGGATPFNLEVTLSAASEKPVTVNYATVEDTATQVVDFTAASGTVDLRAARDDQDGHRPGPGRHEHRVRRALLRRPLEPDQRHTRQDPRDRDDRRRRPGRRGSAGLGRRRDRRRRGRHGCPGRDLPPRRDTDPDRAGQRHVWDGFRHRHER